MRRFENKVVIITGSSMGLGKALSIELAKQGASIVINGRNAERLKKTHQLLLDRDYDVIAVQGDISNFEDCKKLIDATIKAFGKIDVLINNAGLAAEGNVENTKPEIFKKLMEVNYLGSVYPTLHALPFIKKNKGSILFISSLAAIHGLPYHSIYSSSKMTLTGLAEALKVEMKPYSVHVGIVYVGFTQNDPHKMIYKANGEQDKIPPREGVKVEAVENVANRIMDILAKKRYKTTFSFIGKLFSFLNRFFPFAIEMIFQSNYKKKYLEK